MSTLNETLERLHTDAQTAFEEYLIKDLEFDPPCEGILIDGITVCGKPAAWMLVCKKCRAVVFLCNLCRKWQVDVTAEVPWLTWSCNVCAHRGPNPEAVMDIIPLKGNL